ncbi:MAG: Glutamate racemase [Eubacteriales bacterium SKADARSKE-1]|nr:Glutamate racemase [Eubacteriales bacterium SKADARSKE-1]
MKNKPIGVFDSGLGGLTAVKELLKILPHEDIIYFGDTGRVPYGNRSRETITKYAQEDVSFLLSFDVKMIIAACGTVSSVVSDLGENLNIPFTGVVKPTAKAAAVATKNGKIGIIGTTATIKAAAYQNEIKRINNKIEVFSQDCPLFVPLVENGFLDNDPITLEVAKRYLSLFKEKGIDTLILGCTHYPIISSTISKVVGSHVKIIDSGKETASFAFKKLKANNLLNGKTNPGNCSFYVSDTIESFSKTANLFLGKTLNQTVKKINIDMQTFETDVTLK